MYKIGLSTFSEAATQHSFKERKKEFFKLILMTKNYKWWIPTFSPKQKQKQKQTKKLKPVFFWLEKYLLFKSLCIGVSKYVARKISNLELKCPEVTSPDVNCNEFN